MTNAKINQFWKWFQENEEAYRNLYTLPEKKGKAWGKELYKQLELYSKGVHAEFYWGKTPGEHPIDMVFTSHGRRKFFKRIEKLVSKAPQMEGWNFIALQPVRPLDFLMQREFPDFDIDYDNIWFSYTTISQITGRLWMEVYVEHYGEVPKELAHAISYIIYNMLGEKNYGLGIASMAVRSLFELPKEERGGLIPLSELPAHVAIRELSSLTIGSDGTLGRDL
jgi:hypothetical protein